MANSDMNPAWTRENDVVSDYASFTPVDGGSPTVFAGFIRTITRTGEGKYSIVLKRKFPATGVRWAGVNVVGTAGRRGMVETFLPAAGTMTIGIYTLADVADDGAATEQVLIRIDVKNSTITRR